MNAAVPRSEGKEQEKKSANSEATGRDVVQPPLTIDLSGINPLMHADGMCSRALRCAYAHASRPSTAARHTWVCFDCAKGAVSMTGVRWLVFYCYFVFAAACGRIHPTPTPTHLSLPCHRHLVHSSIFLSSLHCLAGNRAPLPEWPSWQDTGLIQDTPVEKRRSVSGSALVVLPRAVPFPSCAAAHCSSAHLIFLHKVHHHR